MKSIFKLEFLNKHFSAKTQYDQKGPKKQQIEAKNVRLCPVASFSFSMQISLVDLHIFPQAFHVDLPTYLIALLIKKSTELKIYFIFLTHAQ